MQIRIAAFGSKGMISRINKFGDKLDKVDIQSYIYNKPEESKELVREVDDCDVLFFTGPVPYYYSFSEIKRKRIPAVHVPFDELMVSLSLHFVQLQLDKDIHSISIDIAKAECVYNVYHELGMDATGIHVKEYDLVHGEQRYFDTEEIVRFHLDLWRKQKVSFVLTSINAVYERLKALGVQCFRMIVPEKNILRALQEASARGELMISKSSQIAVGFVHMKDYEDELKTRGELTTKQTALQLHQILLAFGKQIDASIQHMGEGQFLIFGTRGSLDYLTNQYRELPILSEIKNKLDVDIRIGFGYGLTAKEAERHAQIALHHADQYKDSTGYIVTDEKMVIGPLHEAPQSYHLRSDNKKILHLAEKTRMSVANISKLFEFLKARRYQSFTSHDLADYFQISKRSAERIIKRLVDNRVAEIVGEEQPYQKGRPRNIYRVTQGADER